MPPVFTEGRHAGEFLLSEADGMRSRDNITVKSGAGILAAGTVLGKETVGAATPAAKAGGNTGNGVLTMDGTTPVKQGAKTGIYTVRCIAAASNSGTFRVEDPDGNVLGDVVVAATFDDDIKFSIADGSADFIVGDGFDITVAAGTGKYVSSPATGVTGAEKGSAILLDKVDATAADVNAAAITRDAEVNGKILSYAASVDDDPKKAAKAVELAAAGIIVR